MISYTAARVSMTEKYRSYARGARTVSDVMCPMVPAQHYKVTRDNGYKRDMHGSLSCRNTFQKVAGSRADFEHNAFLSMLVSTLSGLALVQHC